MEIMVAPIHLAMVKSDINHQENLLLVAIAPFRMKEVRLEIH
jgi:hypothetical protein